MSIFPKAVYVSVNNFITVEVYLRIAPVLIKTILFVFTLSHVIIMIYDPTIHCHQEKDKFPF